MRNKVHQLPDGAALAYVDAGAGRPVVMLHGVLTSSRFFDRNVTPLAERLRVIAIDLRGHGNSAPCEGGYTVPQMARDVRSLIVDLGLDGVIALGWSMGNFVFWDYLAQFGDDSRLTAQVCVSQGPSDLNTADWRHGITDWNGLRDLLRRTQEDYDGVCGETATIMTKNLPSPDDRAWMETEMRKLRQNAATCIIADQTLRDYFDLVTALPLPMLAMWGRDEKCVPLAAGEWLTTAVPDIELHVFDKSGHMPMWEEPELFNALLLEWLRGRGWLQSADGP